MVRFLAGIYRFLLFLRYKVDFKGSDLLKEGGAKLLLPNHQANSDSQILFAYLFKHIDMVPIVGEKFYNISVLKPIFKKIRAVPVSDLARGNRDPEVLNKIFNSVIGAMNNNENVVLYPAGHLCGQGFEKIFNKKSAWHICGNVPEDSRIIGVRISGLWGSMWSKAWTGKSPRFFKMYLRAIFMVFANFIFFIPRRKVTIEFEDITLKAREAAKGDVQGFNNFLESFYNIRGEEKVRFVRHYFFSPKLKREIPDDIENSVKQMQDTQTVDLSEIPIDVFEKIQKIIEKEAECEHDKIKIEANISLDLGIDSISMVAIISSIESQFKNVPAASITKLKTVADLCMLAMGLIEVETDQKPSFLNEFRFPLYDVQVNPDDSITESFIKAFSKNKTEHFSYDKIMGSTDRKTFMMKAYVVSKIIRKEIKDTHVGIMLPAMQATTLLVAATYLAGKIPVMFNWTGGQKVMDHCMSIVKVNTILTAGKFYDKVEDQLSKTTKKKCMFFERKVAEAGLGVKLSGLFSFFLKLQPAKVKPNDIAVILFTSGSESLPKAVPLTHKNLMYNIDASLKQIKIKTDKIVLSFLPPFHSFGFSILTIMPLVTALKVAYTPDPTDNREILKVINHTKSSILLATPTFLKMILSVAGKNELSHVKLAITGAESLHSSIINEFYQKAAEDAVLLEGYGITECSPVLTINPLGKQKEKSVGTFVKGVDFVIANLSTNEPVPANTEGMIFVRGANIFNGYPDPSIESPFVDIQGHTYYKTGDLGYVDDDNYLYITGRLKRFIKIAGEMISLGAIESTLLEKFGSSEELVLAIDGNDKCEPPEIVLYSTKEISLAEANTYLKEQGYANLVKINHLRNIEVIPLLGTGKTDYKQLKNLVPIAKKVAVQAV